MPIPAQFQKAPDPQPESGSFASPEADSQLDSLIGDHGGDDGTLRSTPEPDARDGDGPARDASGKFRPKDLAEEVDARGETPVENDDDQDEKPPKAKPEYSTEDYAEALRALARDGYSRERIQKMSDEDIVEIGTMRKEHQAKIDALISKRKSDDPASLQQDGTTDGANAGTPPAADQAASEIGDAMKALREYINTDYGDDALAGHLETVLGTMSKRIDVSAKENDGLRSQLIVTQDESSRQALLKDYPRLAEPEVFTRVKERMKSTEGTSSDRAKLMQEAVFAELGPEMIQELRNSAAGARRDASTPGPYTARSKKPAPKVSMTRDNAIDDSIDALMAGDPDKANRIIQEARTV